jgi:hypothetical protein
MFSAEFLFNSNGIVKMWKEMTVTYFNIGILFQHLPILTDESRREFCQDRQSRGQVLIPGHPRQIKIVVVRNTHIFP